jgi:hypothetical protein
MAGMNLFFQMNWSSELSKLASTCFTEGEKATHIPMINAADTITKTACSTPRLIGTGTPLIPGRCLAIAKLL